MIHLVETSLVISVTHYGENISETSQTMTIVVNNETLTDGEREIRERGENSKLISLCDVDSLNLVSGSPAKINDILTVSMSGRDEEISLLSRGDCDCSAIPNGEEGGLADNKTQTQTLAGSPDWEGARQS